MAMAARREAWEKRMPADVDRMWPFIGTLSLAEQLDLLAHCAVQTVDAAAALGLDMRATWSATAAGYFMKVSKEHILAAVREGVTPQAAENIAGLKEAGMAEAAAERLNGKGWLPALLRTPRTAL